MTARTFTGEERRLVFENVANDVPRPEIMAAFCASSLEIDSIVAFVCKKLREYRFRRRLPPLQCETAQDIRFNRRALLENLRKLGDEYLSSELILPRVTIQKVDSPAMLQEAAHRMKVGKA